MHLENLIRWAGLVAVISGISFAALDFFNFLALVFSDETDGEAITSLSEQLGAILGPVASVLLLLGLVGLYAAESEAAGTAGLVGFLLAFCSGVLRQSSAFFPYWVSALGWGIFGASSLQAQVFPRLPAILLTVSVVLAGISSESLPEGLPAYINAISFLVFDVSVIWLGATLFSRRTRVAQLVDLDSRVAKAANELGVGEGVSESPPETVRDLIGELERLKDRLQLQKQAQHAAWQEERESLVGELHLERQRVEKLKEEVDRLSADLDTKRSKRSWRRLFRG